jgi:sortase (surface protein transpeptidase)
MAIKKHLYTKLGITLWAMAAVFAILPSWPHLYYRINASASQNLATTIANTAITPTPTSPTPSPTEKPTEQPNTVTTTPSLPPQDHSLPTKNGLIIEKIGVKGEINEGEDWEKILRKGIWRVPNFATPADFAGSQQGVPTQPSPIILAAHRWGYLEWSAAFRKLNSFYNLPKLQEGDKIELVWEQRKYKYEVTAISTGTKIEDYSYDLILYTCQLWNSPIRFFVYASRIN